MNKVIEANFLPREPDGDFSWLDSTPISRVNEKRRILIVDNDRNATHLVRILLENRPVSRAGREQLYHGLPERSDFSARPDLAGCSHADKRRRRNRSTNSGRF